MTRSNEKQQGGVSASHPRPAEVLNNNGAYYFQIEPSSSRYLSRSRAKTGCDSAPPLTPAPNVLWHTKCLDYANHTPATESLDLLLNCTRRLPSFWSLDLTPSPAIYLCTTVAQILVFIWRGTTSPPRIEPCQLPCRRQVPHGQSRYQLLSPNFRSLRCAAVCLLVHRSQHR